MSAADELWTRPLADDILEALADAVVVIDAEGRVVHATGRAASLVAVPPGEAVGRSVLDFFPERIRDSVAVALARFLDEGSSLAGREVELPVLTSDGDEVAVSLMVSPSRTPAGHVVATLRPVEGRGLAEQQLLGLLAAEQPLADTLEALLRALGSALEWEVGSCWLPAGEGATSMLRPVATWCARPGALDAYAEVTRTARFVEGEGPVGSAWAAGDARWVADPRTDPRFVTGGSAASAGLRTGLVFPLVDHGEPIAVLEFYGTADRAAELWLEAELQALAGRLGPVVRRRILEERAADEHKHLDLALEAGQMGVWSWEIGTGRVRWSTHMERLCGLEPGTFGGTVEDYWAIVHPDDREHAERSLRISAEQRTPHQIRHRVVLPSGATRWLEGMGRVVSAAAGEPMAMIGVAVDVTARERLAEHLRREARIVELLHQVGQTMSSRLDLQEVVQLVTDTAVRLTHARFGAYFSNVDDANDGGDGSYDLFTLSGLPREAFAGFPAPRVTPLFEPTFRGDGPVRLADVTTDPRFGRNPPHHGFPKGHLPVRSYLAVPVSDTDGAVVGGLFLGHEQPGRFTAEDERIVAGIASQAGIAIDNARRFDRERRTSLALQESLLPSDVPSFPDLAIGVRYFPGAPGNMVGGDWYDVLDLGAGWTGLAIGDVCGHGMPAAAAMAQLRHGLAAVLLTGAGPAAAMAALNRLALGRLRTTVTMAFVRLHRATGRFEVWSAGHLPPVVVGAGGSCLLELPGDPLLGVYDELELRSVSGALGAGESLVLFTDGLIERRGEVLDVGLRRLLETSRRRRPGPGDDLGAFCDVVHAEVCGADRHPDDAAMLVGQRR